jgi:glycosyltransferase involved in cell wall biosynthesis
VGRLVPEKRQLDLIRAYQAISPCEWKLVIVGALATDAYSREVKAAADSAGVVLTGFLKGAALQQAYSHAGAFTLPSSHEGLPIAMLEALSYGLPILASDIPANLEVGLETSSYFPMGNVPALAASMRCIINKPMDARQKAERRNWVASRFNWDRIAEQTMRVYLAATQQALRQ